VLFASALLAACAGTGSTPTTGTVSKQPLPTGESACFYAEQVQNFRVLDRSNLIVYAPNESNAYRVTISPPSTDLRFTDTVAFRPAAGRICGYAGQRLVVGAALSPDVVAIINVARLSRASLDALRGESGGDARPAVQPQPGPGADVEGDGGQVKPAAAGQTPEK
jgi:hypothetical protein